MAKIQVYKCDCCGKIYHESEKKLYINHLRKHVKQNKLIKAENIKKSKYNDMLRGFRDIVKKDIISISKVDMTEFVKSSGDLYPVGTMILLSYEDHISVVDRIELKRTTKELYAVIRVTSDNYGSPVSKVINDVDLSAIIKNPIVSGSYSRPKTNRIIMEISLGDYNLKENSKLYGMWKKAYTTAKLKTSAVKFTRTTFKMWDIK